MKNSNRQVGPIQFLAVGFDADAKVEGKILRELEKLEKNKLIRILDILFVAKEKKGNEISALNIQGEELGAIVGTLFGFKFDGTSKQNEHIISTANENAFGINARDIENLGKTLKPGTITAVLLIEHIWARDLRNAIRDTGGKPIAEGFLTQEALGLIEADVAAIASAMDELESEEKNKMPPHYVGNL